MMTAIECNRCAKCCYNRYAGLTMKCPHLIKNVDGINECDIYDRNDRIGTYIGTIRGKRFYCNNREDVPKNYDECPYNREEWK